MNMNTQQIVKFIRELKAPSEYLVVYFPEKDILTKQVCTTCAHVGPPTRHIAGRADVERALWASLIVLGMIYLCDSIIIGYTKFFLLHWFYKLASMAEKILLVLCMAYTVMRLSLRSKICAKCGAAEIIPLDSPRGKTIVASHPPHDSAPDSP